MPCARLLASGASVSSIQRLKTAARVRSRSRSAQAATSASTACEEVRNGLHVHHPRGRHPGGAADLPDPALRRQDLTLVRLRMRYPDQASTGALTTCPPISPPVV